MNMNLKNKNNTFLGKENADDERKEENSEHSFHSIKKGRTPAYRPISLFLINPFLVTVL